MPTLGDMAVEPDRATLPIPGLMTTVLALVTSQLSVAEPPALILAGLTENELITG